jgi:type 2 lantibiotic biosynthesis protein LanM
VTILPARTKALIAARARTVFERSRAVENHARQHDDSSEIDASADALVRAWNQAFSPGDPEAFAHRLRWDGLDYETALRAAVDPATRPTDDPLPEWTAWLDVILEASAQVAERDLQDASREQSVVQLAAELPFVEIWSALPRVGRRELERRVDRSVLDALAPEASRALERQLLRDVNQQSELALHDWFTGRAAESSERVDPSSGAGGYERFVNHMLAGGLAEFFIAFPVLAREIAVIADRWVDATAEFLNRLHDDRFAIAAFTSQLPAPCSQLPAPSSQLPAPSSPLPLGQVVSIDPALSDPHHGRRSVMSIEFESGLRLIYKPRDVRIEAALSRLISWMVAEGVQAAPRPLRIIDRAGYGWVEFAKTTGFHDRDEVRRFYRSAGGAVCLAYAFRAKDLHMENVVAGRSGPALVDPELFLQPISRAAEEFHTTLGPLGTRGLVEESCLGSGLVRLIETGPDGLAYDVGGLCGDGTGRRSIPRRVWKDLRSGSLHFATNATFAAATPNRVVVDGVVEKPDAHRDAIADGFTEVYRFLLARREELLDDRGPAAFTGCSTRVVARPTNQYAMLNDVLSAPRYQRDGMSRSAAIDVLHRVFAGATATPRLWPVAVAERHALEALDIPHFVVGYEGAGVYSDDRLVVDGYFSQPGRTAVRERLERLSEEDLQIQLDFLNRALTESPQSRFQTPAPSPRKPEPAHDAPLETRTVLFDHAAWIANELLARSIAADEALTWPDQRLLDRAPGSRPYHLYDGSPGVALFFAAMAASANAHESQQDDRWIDAARAAILPVKRFAELLHAGDLPADEPIGACNGLGSIAYGLTLIGDLIDDAECVGLAVRVSREIRRLVDADCTFDVLGGAAGAILTLLAFFDRTEVRTLLDAAIACGDHLVAHAVEIDDGVAWPGSSDALLVGFAHGAAGIAYALSHLWRATEIERFRDVATKAYRFERRQFLSGPRNWPVASPHGDAPAAPPVLMTAWCHGAPGIALANALAIDVVPGDDVRAEIVAALETTAMSPPSTTDHLCCGNFGRVEALFTAGRALGDVRAVKAACDGAGQLMARARARGHFRPSSSSFEYRVFDPGFFRGLSGIGYQLLRLAAPSELPSVLSFEGFGHAGAARGLD